MASSNMNLTQCADGICTATRWRGAWLKNRQIGHGRASGITRRVSLEWSRSNRIGLRSGEGINYQNTSVTIKRAVEVRARPPFARKEAKDGAPSSCRLGKGAPPARRRTVDSAS